jgi:di/tricarboxylate transporter
LSKDINISPSKLLIPLSFSALFGGVGTLIGTSTNILVSSIAYKHGMPSFGMFEMTPFGIIVLAVGLIYMLAIGIRLLPNRQSTTELIKKYEMGDYITEIILLPNAESVDKQIQESSLVNDLDIDIIEIRRADNYRFFPSPVTILKGNDILKVRCDIDKLKELQQQEGISIRPDKRLEDKDLNLSEATLVEAVVTHNSRLRGRTIKGINFRETYGATVLAIKQRGQLMHEKLGRTRIRSGDVLLIEVKKDWLLRLKQNQDFIIVSEAAKSEVKKGKLLTALLIMTGVVSTAAFGIFPIVQSAVIGSVLMVLTKCISLDEAYKAINWKVIFLLAGVLTLGLALEKSGGASFVSSILVKLVGGLGNTALISAFFLLTLLLTNFMSNNATAALLAPIAILTAQSLGVNPRPFLMAVTFAASLSFMTPVGYQTNTMVMGPGNYKFKDYLKVGAPLDLILWILATLLIPVFYPF